MCTCAYNHRFKYMYMYVLAKFIHSKLTHVLYLLAHILYMYILYMYTVHDIHCTMYMYYHALGCGGCTLNFEPMVSVVSDGSHRRYNQPIRIQTE